MLPGVIVRYAQQHKNYLYAVETDFRRKTTVTEASSKSVLVVDDSRISRMLIKNLVLARFPQWVVTEAASGDAAVALAREFSFDYCTMDINMPGIPGTDAAEQLLTLHPTLRVALFSANIQEAQHVRAAQLGVPFVAKPVTEKSVAQALAHFQG
jgi:two-component system chemotaxis response regulator CheY